MTEGIQLDRILAGKSHRPVVYFIRHGDGVKIGTTTWLRRRVGSMYLRLEDVLLLVPGGHEVEASYHERFSEYRIEAGPRRELFRLAGGLRDFLRPADLSSPAPGELLTLSEAVSAGVLRSCLATARTQRHRDPSFPKPVSVRGMANLYSRAELADWHASREMANAPS